MKTRVKKNDLVYSQEWISD